MPDRIFPRIAGPRGSALMAMGVTAVMHGIAYSPLTVPPFPLPAGLLVLAATIPLRVYAAAWIAAGVVAIIGSITTNRGQIRDRWDAWGFGACAGMLVVWSFAHLLGLLAPDPGSPTRAVIAFVLYAGFATVLASCARGTKRIPRPEAEGG